jgi:NAD(P)H-hydrate repair Nnr-like enzyme with NAD(P)H-hydrate dehydratase domain
MKTKQSETLLSSEYISSLIRKRKPSGHKGTFGHALIVAGSTEKTGAAILSSTAALKSGCGLLTAAIPTSAVTPLMCRLPEAMVLLRDIDLAISSVDISTYDAIGFGPGVGITKESAALAVSYFVSTPTTFGDRCRWNYPIGAEQRLVRIIETQYYPNATCWRI